MNVRRFGIFCVAFVVALMMPLAAHAQTNTPAPTGTATPTPQATYTPYSLSDIQGTLGVAGTIPALSLTPKPWNTPTRPPPGAAFHAPTYIPQTPTIGEDQAHGFEAISQTNVTGLGRFLAETAVAFYGWLTANFPTVLHALRIFSFIVFFMAVLMALFRRFAPTLASKSDNWRKGEGKIAEKGTGK